MTDIDLKAMGERIRKQRKALGYNRETFAEKLGISERFCSSIELGTSGMSFKTLLKVSDVLNLSTDYILTGYSRTNDANPINEIIRLCPQNKIKYAEEILSTFLLSCFENDNCDN